MYNSRSTPAPSTSDAAVDSTPLLASSMADRLFRSRRLIRRPPPPLRGASRFLRRASGRRLMLRDPSVRVRETAAEQLEESQSNWAYSKPIVVLDIIWNLAFVGIAAVVMGLSLQERPELPLRLWIVGYVLQCAFHIACVVAECRRRRVEEAVGHGGGDSGSNSNLGSGSEGGDSEEYVTEESRDSEETSVAKHLESANTMFSFIWWIIGFYWVTAGGQTLTQDSPQLYWLCITFLAFDVVFVVICVAVASLIGIAVCCCLPCIIAILYVMTDQEGATKEDIDQLPKYKFCRVGDFEKVDGEVQETYTGTMTECDTDTPTQRTLSMEDCECCICISSYEDGNEVRELPCNHHFHCACIDKWLYINATCPLCKFNILKARDQSDSGEV